MSFDAGAGHWWKLHTVDRRGHDDRHERRHRPHPLDRPLRALRGDAHDRARRHRRERRAAVDPGRPRLLDLEPRLGRQRLSHRLRRAAAALGPLRRPARPQARPDGRPRRLHPRIAAVRPRLESGDARRGAVRPGHRRRDDLGRDPRDDLHDVPRAARAREGDRGLRLRRLRGRLDRPAGRRRADAVDQLPLDLLREHPDRDRHGDPGAARRAARRGHRHPPGRGRRGRRAHHGLPHAHRLHDRRAGGRERLGLGRGARPARPRGRAAGGVHPARVARGYAARAAADLPLAHALGRQRRPGADGRRDVRDVLPRLAVPPARARLRRAADRPGIPAGHAS